MPDEEFAYDLFVSHASEDKAEFVAPLAEALRHAGLDVWYDRFTLQAGDSLRESIDQGLVDSRFGVMVLSRDFFRKEWPKREFAGLSALAMNDGRRRIIPIWHNVAQEEVLRYSPPLADLLAINSNEGIEQVVRKIIRLALAAPMGIEPVYSHIIRDQNVDVVDLSRSIGREDTAIEGYVFERCHFVGPAVLLPSGCHIENTPIGKERWFPIDDERPYIGLIPLLRCVLASCTLGDIGLAAPHRDVHRYIYAIS